MTRSATGNNFDALRLLFAGTVCVFHIAALSRAFPDPRLIAALDLGADLAIQGFFVISGCLVYGSLRRSAGLGDYATRRTRRLLPAYAVVVVGAALAAIVTTPAARADLLAVGRYLAANLAFLNFLVPNLPGVFASNPFTEVNGALWTIKIEVAFYMALPIAGALLGRMTTTAKAGFLLACYLAGEAWRAGLAGYAADAGPFWARLSYQFPGQMAFFASGMALSVFGDRLRPSAGLLLASAMVLCGALLLPWPLGWLRAAGLAGVIWWAAYGAPVRLRAARHGDLSYGLYVVHFPIVQLLVAAGWFAASRWLAATAAFVLALGAAFAMWHLVERPALRRDSHYRRAEARPTAP